MRFQTLFRTAALSFLMLLSHGFSNKAEALPDGFQDHGIAAPVGREPFGNNTFAAVDGEGRRIVFMKLWTGNDASYLIIKAKTGETQQIDPKIPGRGGWPVFSGPNNKIYDTLGKNFVEIDLNSRSFRKIGTFSGSMSLGYAIDSDEVIYAGIYPTGELISYDTRKDEYQDLGKISHENWPQYLRPLVAGKDGWIYVGLGQKVANLIAYHPGKRESKGLIPEKERKVGRGEVITGTDGKIYGNAPGWGWHILENGEAKPVEKPAKKITAPSTREFPDGSKLLSINAPNKTMIIRDAGKSADREVSFSYKSSGVRIYGVTGGPDGKIYGATGIPLRVWQLDPKTGKIENWGLGDHVGHVNQFVLQNEKLYGAVYSSGSLIEYDPAKPFHDTNIRRSRNPKHLHGFTYGHGGNPDMFGRPYAVFAHPDGKHILVGGNPSRVHAGGGLLIYNIETGKEIALKPDQLVKNQGVMAIAALQNGDPIIGSTTVAATAGVSAAKTAQIYQLDWKTKKVLNRWTPKPAVGSIRDLLVDEDDLIYIYTTGNRFLILDPKTGEFVHDERVTDFGAQTGGQAPRVMTFGPDGKIYMLFRDAIAAFDRKNRSFSEVARPGISITAGIAIQDGFLYFASGSRLLNWKLP